MAKISQGRKALKRGDDRLADLERRVSLLEAAHAGVDSAQEHPPSAENLEDVDLRNATAAEESVTPKPAKRTRAH